MRLFFMCVAKQIELLLPNRSRVGQHHFLFSEEGSRATGGGDVSIMSVR